MEYIFELYKEDGSLMGCEKGSDVNFITRQLLTYPPHLGDYEQKIEITAIDENTFSVIPRNEEYLLKKIKEKE